MVVVIYRISVCLLIVILYQWVDYVPVLCKVCYSKRLRWTPYVGKELSCPDDESKYLTNYNVLEVPWGKEDRAWFTAPPQVQIKQSMIQGYGAVSKTFISAHTWLGEYEGDIIPKDNRSDISAYAWGVKRDHQTQYYVDAGKVETSNWLRWINCARTKAEQSVKACYCMGKVLYVTIKDVYPAQELLVYYGHSYAKSLGIDTSTFP